MTIANLILCSVAAICMLAHAWGLLHQTPPAIGHGFVFAVLAVRLFVYFFWEG